MTEAVKAMCGWALKQNGVTSVIAETDLEGLASQKILKRCGFKKIKKEKLFGGDYKDNLLATHSNFKSEY